MCLGIGLDTVVHRDDVEHVEQLPLVLVNTLDVNVENRVHVDVHGIVCLEHLRKTLLVLWG